MLIFSLVLIFYPSGNISAVSSPSRAYYTWAKVIGGIGRETPYSSILDSSGNLYMTGRFQDTVNFNPDGTDNHTSIGLADTYITKYNSSGTYAWTKTISAEAAKLCEAFSIAKDTSNNIYITGRFQGTVNFNPDGLDNHTSNGSTDFFITKFNSNATYGWTKTIGGALDDSGNALYLDTNNNLYITGVYSDTVNFDPVGIDNHISNGNTDIFITKYTSAGAYLWTKTVGGLDNENAQSIKTDSSGNIYVSGQYSDTVNFDPDGVDNHTSNGDYDLFLTKYNTAGENQWTKTIGGIDEDDRQSIAIDSSGNIYTAGVFQNTVNFNPDGIDNQTGGGWYDIFLTKYNSNGTYAWTKVIGGADDDYVQSISIDTENNVFLTGYFGGTVNFNPDGTDNHTSTGSYGSYVTKFDSDGTYDWTDDIEGTGTDSGYSILTGQNNVLYLIGTFDTDINLSQTGTDNHTSSGSDDIFYIKMTNAPISINAAGDHGQALNFTLSTTALSYQIVLLTIPTNDVTITITPPAGISLSQTTLTFTSLNWNTPQTINVTVSNRNLFTEGQTYYITHSASSADPGYNGITISNMSVTVEKEKEQNQDNEKQTPVPIITYDIELIYPIDAVKIDDRTPLLDWNPAAAGRYLYPNIEYYEIYLDGDLYTSVQGSETEYQIENSLELGLHSWQVIAFRSDPTQIYAEIARSQEETFEIITNLYTFELIYPVDVSIDEATPLFTWTSLDTKADFDYYRIYIDDSMVQNEIAGTEYQLTSDRALDAGKHSWYVEAYKVEQDGTENMVSKTDTAIFEVISFKELPTTAAGGQSNSKLIRLILSLLPLSGTALATIVTAALILPLSLRYLAANLGVLLGSIFSKNRKYWGIVFDKSNNKCIPFAMVELLEAGKPISRTVTDPEGRYGLLVEQNGKYILRIKAGGYMIYEKSFNITNLNKEILADIGLERNKGHYNPLNQYRYYAKNELFSYFQKSVFVLMFIGLSYSLYVFIDETSRINILIMLAYLLIFALNIFLIIKNLKRKIGRVADKTTKAGIPGVVIRIYDPEGMRELVMTNDKGHIKVNIKPGMYKVRLNKAGYEYIKPGVDFIDINIVKGGYIKNDILMEKTSLTQSGTSPF